MNKPSGRSEGTAFNEGPSRILMAVATWEPPSQKEDVWNSEKITTPTGVSLASSSHVDSIKVQADEYHDSVQ